MKGPVEQFEDPVHGAGLVETDRFLGGAHQELSIASRHQVVAIVVHDLTEFFRQRLQEHDLALGGVDGQVHSHPVAHQTGPGSRGQDEALPLDPILRS